jgi:hypothetical protein
MRPESLKTFATFRIVGDALDPDEVTNFFKVAPTQAYAKGDRYFAGKKSGELLGKTGMWYLSTDRTVASNDLTDHLAYLIATFQVRHDSQFVGGTQLTANLIRFKKMMSEKALIAKVTCFWYGSAGSRKPSIPRAIADIFRFIDAEIETDFDTDEPPVSDRAMAG